jgi:hypothetical protein
MKNGKTKSKGGDILSSFKSKEGKKAEGQTMMAQVVCRQNYRLDTAEGNPGESAPIL